MPTTNVALPSPRQGVKVPLDLPLRLNSTLGVGAVLGSMERGLGLRYNETRRDEAKRQPALTNRATRPTVRAEAIKVSFL